MIFRISALLLSSVAAYVLLRGWPELLPDLVRGCLAVLALVAGIGLWAKRPQADGPLARGRRIAGWLDYTSVAAAVLAIECAFLWLLIAAPKPLENVALIIEEKFLPDASARRTLDQASQQAVGGNWLWTDQSRRPLPQRTNLKPGNRPEVFLRTSTAEDVAVLLNGQIYVRSFVLGSFEKSAWSTIDPQRMEIRPDASGFIALVPPELRIGKLIEHEVFHAADPGGQNVLTGLQGAALVRLPRVSRMGDGFHLLPESDASGGFQYTVASAPLRLEDLPEESVIMPKSDVPPALLNIPAAGDFGKRVKAMTRAATGEGSLLQQLLNTRDHLRSKYGYSLQTANSMNLDPLENFLFFERRGHCEYFASAGAMMARALGVPSRVAYGWAGGTYYESSNWFVFRSREAHAWTEVWLEGLGWVVMDPTPPPAIGGERTRQAQPDEAVPLQAGNESGDDTSEADGNGGTMALWLLAGFGVPALLLMAVRGGRSRRLSQNESADHPSGEPPGYLLAWQRARARRGLPSPASGTTLRREMRGISPAPPFEAEMWLYHYGTRYGDRPKDPGFEKMLLHRIREWELAGDNSGINPAPEYPMHANE